MSNDLSKYVTTKQAAEMLGVATTHVNYLLLTHRIRGFKPGDGWNWLVYVPSIEKYNQTKSARGRPRSKEMQAEEPELQEAN